MKPYIILIYLFLINSLSSMEKTTPCITSAPKDEMICIKTSDHFIFYLPKKQAIRSLSPIRILLKSNPSQSQFKFRNIVSSEFIYCYLHLINNGNDRSDIELLIEELDEIKREELINTCRFLEYWPLLILLNTPIILKELDSKILPADLTLYSLEPDYIYFLDRHIGRLVEKTDSKPPSIGLASTYHLFAHGKPGDDIRILEAKDEPIGKEDFLPFPHLREICLGPIKKEEDFDNIVDLFSNFSNLCALRLLARYPDRFEEFPHQIYQLTNLKELELSCNERTSISSKLSNLGKLEVLDLFGIKSFPEEFRLLTNLKELHLCQNGLSILPGLSRLTKLEKMNLRFNKFNPFPPDIGALVNLKDLNISANKLHDLPPAIGLLSNLQVLDLGQNMLTSLPVELGNLIKLEQLNIWMNQLTELPAIFSKLTNLTHLYSQGNPLTTLPTHLSSLIALQELRLHATFIKTNPTELHPYSALTNLKALWIWSQERRELSLTTSEKDEIKDMFKHVRSIRIH